MPMCRGGPHGCPELQNPLPEESSWVKQTRRIPRPAPGRRKRLKMAFGLPAVILCLTPSASTRATPLLTAAHPYLDPLSEYSELQLRRTILALHNVVVLLPAATGLADSKDSKVETRRSLHQLSERQDFPSQPALRDPFAPQSLA